jgi:hypothetical protein
LACFILSAKFGFGLEDLNWLGRLGLRGDNEKIEFWYHYQYGVGRFVSGFRRNARVSRSIACRSQETA